MNHFPPPQSSQFCAKCFHFCSGILFNSIRFVHIPSHNINVWPPSNRLIVFRKRRSCNFSSMYTFVFTLYINTNVQQIEIKNTHASPLGSGVRLKFLWFSGKLICFQLLNWQMLFFNIFFFHQLLELVFKVSFRIRNNREIDEKNILWVRII